MIRILHVLGGLNCGGAETMLMNYYRNIDKKKIQFDFIIHTQEKQFYEEEIKKMGGKIYRISRYKIYNHPKYKDEWRNFFKEHPEYKIIHGHMRSTAAIYLKIAKNIGLTTICHSHSISNGINLSAFIKNLLQLNIRNIADYFMGCSYEANKWLFGHKIANSNRCQIINNGINIEKFLHNPTSRNKFRDELKIEKNEILIGHVGRFEKVKNHKFIFETFEKLYSENQKYKLLLIGTGPLKKQLIKKYQNSNFMKNVIILEPVKNINEYMQAMDIFILPSKYEGLGIVLIEAQISGLKCIASTNVPNHANITPNIVFLDLNIEKWKNELKISINKLNERNFQDYTVFNSFNIKENCQSLSQFYLEIKERKNEKN